MSDVVVQHRDTKVYVLVHILWQHKRHKYYSIGSIAFKHKRKSMNIEDEATFSNEIDNVKLPPANASTFRDGQKRQIYCSIGSIAFKYQPPIDTKRIGKFIDCNWARTVL